MLKLLVGAASIAIIAYVGWFFVGQFQVAQAGWTADRAMEERQRAVSDCQSYHRLLDAEDRNRGNPQKDHAALLQLVLDCEAHGMTGEG